MNDWQRLTSPLRRRIKQMLSRAIGRLVDPSTLLQTLQLELFKGEVLDNIEHLEGYGRTAHPPAGFEALTASLGGDRSHTVCLAAIHRQFRVRNLAQGEQVLYDDLGNVIWFKRDRILISAVDHVEVNAPTCNITSTTTHDGDMTINGDLQVNGNTTINGMLTVSQLITGQDGLAISGASGATVTGGDINADGISLKTHVHGGVQAGSDNTGGPQ